MDAGLLRCGDDAVAVPEAERHRLLQEDGFAGLGGGHAEVGVLVRLAADHHRLDLRIAEDVLEVGRVAYPEGLRLPLAPGLVVVPGGDEAGVFEADQLTAISAHVSVREAQHAYAGGAHALFPLSTGLRLRVSDYGRRIGLAVAGRLSFGGGAAESCNSAEGIRLS